MQSLQDRTKPKEVKFQKTDFVKSVFKIYGDKDVSYLICLSIAISMLIKFKKGEITMNDVDKLHGYFVILCGNKKL